MVKHAVKIVWSFLVLLTAVPPAASAQQPEPGKAAERDARGPSMDGDYWFEVEVTIFSSVYGGSRSSEVPVPENTNLRYPGQLRRLQNQNDSYKFPFAADASGGSSASLASPRVVPFGEGPLYSPADPAAFKILDHERDPFLMLDRRYTRFTQLNSRLESTGEHKLLWHQVWRQPLKPRAQTQALEVEGGDAFGEHYQLEGSVRVSGTGEAAVIDANLWLSSFSRNRSPEWKLPDRPALAVAGAPVTTQGAGPWYPDTIWQLNQNRDLSPNALYYLDHPTLGLLVEIRPYLVPEARVPTAAPVKPAGKRGFE